MKISSTTNRQTILSFLLSYRKYILRLFLFSIISSGFFLIGPYLSKLFVDKAFLERNLNNFLIISGWGIIIFLVSTLFKSAEDILRNRTTVKLKLNLGNKFIKKLFSLDIDFFQSKSVGENIYRLYDVERIVTFVLSDVPSIMLSFFKLPIIIGIALWINSSMTMLLIILSPLFLFRSRYIQKKLRPIYEEIWNYSAKISKQLCEAFANILIIKALGLDSYQRHRYIKLWIENTRRGLRAFRWSIISSVSTSFLSKAIYGAIALYGGWLIIKGKITLGSYTAVMLYLTQLGGLFESLSHNFEYFAQEVVAFNKFLEVMDAKPKIKDVSPSIIIGKTRGEILFDNVWFGYTKGPVIKGLTFKIPSFSWVGIVGASGSGKTTLINLILRLYDPWRGQICLDGINLRRIKLGSLREGIAVATQKPLLFDTSFAENIGYGLRGVTHGHIVEAAKIACIHEFIEELPKKYDTVIGEDGCYLSQGIKQRVAIARALLRNASILILDEATSSVDSFTEEKVFNNLREKRSGLSTIIVSHRLFSIRDAERIYFLREDGKIEEETHTQLLAGSALYKKFFHNQLLQLEP